MVHMCTHTCIRLLTLGWLDFLDDRQLVTDEHRWAEVSLECSRLMEEGRKENHFSFHYFLYIYWSAGGKVAPCGDFFSTFTDIWKVVNQKRHQNTLEDMRDDLCHQANKRIEELALCCKLCTMNSFRHSLVCTRLTHRRGHVILCDFMSTRSRFHSELSTASVSAVKLACLSFDLQMSHSLIILKTETLNQR